MKGRVWVWEKVEVGVRAKVRVRVMIRVGEEACEDASRGTSSEVLVFGAWVSERVVELGVRAW